MKIIRKILYFLLILLLIGLAVGLLYLLVLAIDWPLWFGATIGAGLLGLWLAYVVIRKFIVRRKAKRFIKQVVDEDDAVVAGPGVEPLHLAELESHWAESLEQLRSSLLRRKGNFRYVLPWFVSLGETGSGKTSVLRGARLHSPLTDVPLSSTKSGTKNCDWWFFKESIVLDTAGRYSVPVNEERDKDEWKRFLLLLKKQRRKEPVSGAIVHIAADRLLAADEIELREKGQCIRRRVNQLMRVMGARIPVYLMVTKMDLVYGFTDFIDLLPPDQVSKNMGYTNNVPAADCLEIVDSAMTSISESLNEIRLLLVQA
ncbi:MAG: hypothetical protein KAR13_09200, partial [Desulfobulbaceae bacterium]|nr:hypothetical protein [Desulfobulbaceae bacterium]